MKNLSLVLLSLLALQYGTATAATIYLAGDSTVAAGGGGSGDKPSDGWGEYIVSKISADVSNNAIGGRSARSFTREGRFDEIAEIIQAGDYVVIEFGHNDGGSLSDDNGRTDCPGEGAETCETIYDGVEEIVLTFPAYVENAAALFLDKGANVLVSSQTPNNPWESGSFAYEPSRFVAYAQVAAGNAGVEYVDHGAYVADIFDQLGLDTVNPFFPSDHTHTSPEGADVVADAFLKAVVCSGVGLSEVVTATDLPGGCL